ncbi:MAG: uracil-DNA glycosylase [Syntrophobacteraceae bacterium]
MGRPDDVRKRIEDILRQVRWSLVGLEMGGIRDFLRRPVESLISEVPDARSQGKELNKDRTTTSRLSEIDPAQALLDLQQEMGDCKKCRLHSGRNRIVFGGGSPGAGLVFVGEGPGFDEDRQGLPFVGRAGKLLDKMIMSLGFSRDEVYICNVVKCRPPNNRTPNPDEIEICSPFLMQQLAAIQPEAICTLGACASQTLLSTGSSISSLRGKVQRWRGIPVVCTFHPAYLLRNPSLKAAAWQDLIELRRLIQSNPARVRDRKEKA